MNEYEIMATIMLFNMYLAFVFGYVMGRNGDSVQPGREHFDGGEGS